MKYIFNKKKKNKELYKFTGTFCLWCLSTWLIIIENLLRTENDT